MFEMDVAALRRVVRENLAAATAVELESSAPGPELGELLGGVRPEELDMFDAVSYLGACERQLGWVQARQLAGVRALAGRRLVPGPNGEPADSALPAGAVNEFAAEEVAAVLCLARSTGQQRVWLATALARFPATEAALAAGALNLTKVWAIVEELSVLDDEHAQAAEARVLDRAPDQTVGNLRRCLARAVASADPGAAARRAIRARAERRVVLTPHPDGMCEFWALLPAPDAMALWTAVTALAEKARDADRAAARENAQRSTDGTDGHGGTTGAADGTAAGGTAAGGTAAGGTAAGGTAAGGTAADGTGAADGAGDDPVVRSLDQARADVLADLAGAVLDRTDLPRRHRRRPHIQITLAASTALGLDDQPGELAGYGPIPAELARRVAADGIWRRLLTDPVTGGLLDYGRTVYEPPQNLVDHVITRDQTCRGLGCRIAAERCDIDHALRFPDGPTAAHNLSCECRRCHIRKHEAGWTLTLHRNGDITWTSPTGHTYHDPVPPLLEHIPQPRAPAHDTPPF